ncbi:endo-1,4-beta-xylanase [Teredinibacter haidensis]|uniref:endo-1,4-beta-xylanase n=1 Tax=Teredinibacter haidensis TaxID=2731755 RepID=UPI000949138E|nr:endo-1,4-beta-xylanase [Teredinibacter haidensis]
MKAIHSIAFGLGLALASAVQAQSDVAPVVIEAEDGTLGANFDTGVGTDDPSEYIYPNNDHGDVGTTDEPGSDGRVATYSVTLPQAGDYDIYFRFAVGPDVGSDDSFFVGLGALNPLAVDGWTMCNGLWEFGYTEANIVVDGAGSSGAGESFRWVSMTAWDGCQLGVTATADTLTQTFSYGARENGLFIDKFVFGLKGDEFTVADLTEGRAATGAVPVVTLPPIANGIEGKYLGSAYSSSQSVQFTGYFNQLVPENAGKWGSVEATRDTMNWGTLDEAYDFAQSNDIPFRMHVLVWGNQQPAWIEGLTQEEQLEEITEWFDAVAARYPNIDYLEVANEVINDPPSGEGNGNYIDALGGAADNAWLKTAFSMARDRFPNATLLINEYNVLSGGVLDDYKAIIEDLQTDSLVDGIGIQAHAFSTRGPASGIQAALDSLAETGLPIYITEMDIDGNPTAAEDEVFSSEESDMIQLAEYKRLFPVIWDHDAVAGVTLWGYRPGLWRDDQEAFLVNEDGDDRPAAKWLRSYVQGSNAVPVIDSNSLQLSVDEEVLDGTTVANLIADDPDGENANLTNWTIVGGTGLGRFTLETDADGTGLLFVSAGSVLDYETAASYTLDVIVSDENYADSAVTTVTINLNDIENDGVVGEQTIWPAIGENDGNGEGGGGAANAAFLLMLALFGFGAYRPRRKH